MRLVTRGNLDGLACAVLITEAEHVDTIELIHPQDISDGTFIARQGDIIANLPYHPNCSKWFDHHAASGGNDHLPTKFEGKYGLAPSASRLVYEYYEGAHPTLARFQTLVDETDRFDGANLNVEDVTHPDGYILLGFTLDPRTGLGDFREYFMNLIRWVKADPVDRLLERDEVRLRIERLSKDREAFVDVLTRCSRLVGNVVVTDLRGVEKMPAGNRFLVYTLFPQANVSLRVAWGPRRKFVVATVGHSIFNWSCPVHIGNLMARYGGGGHRGAGATPLPVDEADRAIEEMVGALQKR